MSDAAPSNTTSNASSSSNQIDPDLLSILGVAREAAAATGVPLTVPPPSFVQSGEKAEEAATVEVLDPERCPRYLARVIRGVAAGPSPIGHVVS